MNSLSAANTQFALDLFQQFKASKRDDNIFYSPLSISSALAMTFLGAEENTAFEMEKVGVCFLYTDQLRLIFSAGLRADDHGSGCAAQETEKAFP